ncbi:MAG: hypothetical protein M1272_02370 [Firmicutes bacterium]|nr:hypothetical protein [Bacillota bacterium]
MAMWGRRRTPVWVWALALLGLKSLWSWRMKEADPAWLDKRRRFRQKLDEAFQVWREKDSEPESPEPPIQ